ncbi:MAG: hypothetical protein M1828_003694 [Chrysothrix sp. TS-e1954]|nr:MAG: hypothetical protein M1828_003694 [Chrysothrix sp. TS-e1954]
MPIFGLRRLSSGVQAKLGRRKSSDDRSDGPEKAMIVSRTTAPTTTANDDVISIPTVKFDENEPRRSRPPAIFSIHGARVTRRNDEPDTDPPSAWFDTGVPSDDDGLSTTTSVTEDGPSGPVTPQLSPRQPTELSVDKASFPDTSGKVDTPLELVALSSDTLQTTKPQEIRHNALSDMTASLEDTSMPEPLNLSSSSLQSEVSHQMDFLRTAMRGTQASNERLHDEQEAEHPVDIPELVTLMTTLPTELLLNIARYLDPFAAAHFCFSNRELSRRLGPECYPALDDPENRDAKLRFLSLMDISMPDHLLCPQCTTFHFRQHHSRALKADAIAHRPVVQCPRSLHAPTARITADRKLRFLLAHSVMRSHRLGPKFGLPVQSLRHAWTTDISAWTCAYKWSHKLRAIIDQDHLIIRVTSRATVQSNLTLCQKRLLLYSREDYSAMYSTCPHWTHGATLASICRCALCHIPPGPGARPPSQCAECRPLRRCTECATEYLVEVKLREDKSHPDQFRHAIVVTRWTDLGDVKDQNSEEWYAASEADPNWGEGRYSPFDSTDRVKGKDTLRKRFEMAEQVRRVHEGPALALRQKRLWASERDAPWRE